ncbi:hypothetical protein EDB86DRAFT_3079625 [Lactarius hatsudake]|nr:hypothetical protein EDB86DRAFT_3079625 [Lactarius hatsudake]
MPSDSLSFVLVHILHCPPSPTFRRASVPPPKSRSTTRSSYMLTTSMRMSHGFHISRSARDDCLPTCRRRVHPSYLRWNWYSTLCTRCRCCGAALNGAGHGHAAGQNAFLDDILTAPARVTHRATHATPLRRPPASRPCSLLAIRGAALRCTSPDGLRPVALFGSALKDFVLVLAPDVDVHTCGQLLGVLGNMGVGIEALGNRYLLTAIPVDLGADWTIAQAIPQRLSDAVIEMLRDIVYTYGSP